MNARECERVWESVRECKMEMKSLDRQNISR